jgi:subtilase family serine protease
MRPHSWVVVNAGAGAGLVQAPGQTVCNASHACYYTEPQIWTAYGLGPVQKAGNYGQGVTIGVVDAFYDPQTLSNLQNFSTYFHLPMGTGTTSISCSTTPTLTIVNETGGSPSGVGFNLGWAEETNLDVQQAHGMAPCANILLVAANSNSYTDLFTGVQYAYGHSDLVTNSYGGTEFSEELLYDPTLSGSSVPLLFSAGDTGAEAQYPCVSASSTCVGGTTLLTTSASFRTNEYVWGDPSGQGQTGGGCSQYEPQPTYQQGIPAGFTTTTCGAFRGAPDIAALADEFTGVIIGLGSNIEPSAGLYCCIGGTSLSSPLVAGVLADIDGARVAAGKAKLGNNLNTLLYQAASYSPNGPSVLLPPYGNSYRSLYFDVFKGNSGPGQVGGYDATLYWDRATGLGVPYFSALSNYLVTQAP